MTMTVSEKILLFIALELLILIVMLATGIGLIGTHYVGNFP